MHFPSLASLLGPSRPFRSLIAAALSDDLAKGIATFLLPIAAISLSTNPVHVAAVTVCLTVPWLIVGPIAGLVVDRFDRRMLLVSAEGVRFVALATLAAALAVDRTSMALLYGVALLMGTTETLIEPALIASIPGTTPRAWLEEANARVVGGRTITDNGSQTIAGALVSLGIGFAAAIAALGFALAGLCFHRLRLTTMSLPRSAQPCGGSGRVREIGAEIAGGMRVILAMEPLRTITFASAIINGCWAAWWSVWALYAIAPGPVGLSPFGLGLVLACGVASSLAGRYSLYRSSGGLGGVGRLASTFSEMRRCSGSRRQPARFGPSSSPSCSESLVRRDGRSRRIPGSIATSPKHCAVGSRVRIA